MLGATATLLYIQWSRTQELRVLNPNPKWEQIFFRVINQHALLTGLPDLRTVILPENDFEVRVWAGFGLDGEQGLVLQCREGNWSGYYIQGIAANPPYSQIKKELEAPKSGWTRMWERLVEAKILTLPDSDQVNCNVLAKDGAAYVVEINKNKTYRTYRYSNPTLADCKEAQEMIRIGDILAEEFGLKGF